MKEKFLSHRLRGFDEYEHTRRAAIEAFKTFSPYLEIDTRVSKDGVIFICHNSSYITKAGRKISIAKTDSSLINKDQDKHGNYLIRLDDLLNLFSNRIMKNQILLIDIKDYGYEKEHLSLVKKYDVLPNIMWVSWMPQTLLDMHGIDPVTPQILSYVPTPYFLSKLLDILSIKMIPFTDIRFITNNSYLFDKNKIIGKQFALLSHKIPNNLLAILSKTKGGVCVYKFLLSDAKINKYKDNGLRVLVFSAKDKSEFKALAKKEIDVIFCDFIDNKYIS